MNPYSYFVRLARVAAVEMNAMDAECETAADRLRLTLCKWWWRLTMMFVLGLVGTGLFALWVALCPEMVVGR